MNDRQNQLLTFLQERGEVKVGVLVEGLNASEATVRRDLNSLEAAGKLVRTFGGARPAGASSLVMSTFEQKREAFRAEKERIARLAAELVKPGMVIALDNGTTTWRVAAALKDKSPLTIITSSLASIEELGGVKGIGIHLIGGKFRPSSLDFVGLCVSSAWSQFRADLAILGVDSLIPGRGAFCRDESSAAMDIAQAGCADKRILVLDRSKINAGAYCQTVSVSQIDTVITDKGVDEETKEMLLAEPYEVLFA